MMVRLADLGFQRGVIVETVVSTYGEDGKPNAAPMGVVMKNEQRVVIKPYTSSSTYKNLQLKRCAVVNVTSVPEVFYRTAFKEANPHGQMLQEWFEKAEIVDAPRLRMADALIEVSVADVTSLGAEKVEVTCDVKLVKAARILPKVYCRALFATVEAIIHATRVKAFLTRGKQEQALRLLETIEVCRDIVNRVAPNSSYAKIMANLTKMVDSWKGEK